MARLLLVAVVSLLGCASPDAPRESSYVGGFLVELPSYELAPSEEAFPCWVLPLELDGPSRIVGAARLVSPPGLHHGNLTARPKTGEGLRPCSVEDEEAGLSGDILSGGTFIFASSTQIVGEEGYAFPTGHGYRLGEDFEIVARMHYLNTSSQTVSLSPRYEWQTIDESTVEHVLSPFGFVFSDFEIAPNSTKTVTADCPTPAPMTIVTLLPHMHALGTAFSASYLGGERDGDKFLDSPGYDPERGVLTQLDPVVDLTGSSGLSFSCTWSNTFDKTIVEGTGDDEMCMLFGYGYPKVYFGLASEKAGCGVVEVTTVAAPGD
jgi:hypothetical protein